MSSRRTLKAASAIREVVSMAILTELRDPRVKNVTVTLVELSGDMRQAKVHVSIMGTEKQQDLCLHGLQRAAGFLQQLIGDRIDTRYTPRLQFVLDKGIKHSFKVAEILHDVLPPAGGQADAGEFTDDYEDSLPDDLAEDGTMDEDGRADDKTTDGADAERSGQPPGEELDRAP